MSGNKIEAILEQTRESVALSSEQVQQMGELSHTELCALSVVLSRWRVEGSADSIADENILRKPKLKEAFANTPQSPTSLYEQVSRGEKIVPEQLAIIRDWSVPDLLSLVVKLQADLVGSPAAAEIGNDAVHGLERKKVNWRSRSGSRTKRRSRRIAFERWFGLALIVACAVALPFLGQTSAGPALVQAAIPFLLGAASIWLFSQGRWISQSKRSKKAVVGRIVMLVAVIGFLVAAGWILFVALSAGLSFGSNVIG